MIRQYFRIVWTVSFLHLKQMAVDKFVFFTVIVQPLIIALLAFQLLRDVENFQSIYVIVGSAMSGLWSGTIFVSSRSLVGERLAGTLEEIIGGPTELSTIVVSKVLISTIISLASMVFSYPLAALVFDYRLTLSNPIQFILSVPLVIMTFVSLGLVIAPIMILNPEAWIWSNAVEFPIYALSGFLFPVLLLPPWGRVLSYLLSPYWAARILHATSSGHASLHEIVLCWTILMVSSLINFYVSRRLFQVILFRARVDGSLGLQ